MEGVENNILREMLCSISVLLHHVVFYSQLPTSGCSVASLGVSTLHSQLINSQICQVLAQ